MNCATKNTTILRRLRFWNSALIGFAMAATFAAFVGCGSDRQYTEETRSKFLNACSGYESSAWCLCFLGGIEEAYSEEEFLDWVKSDDEDVPSKWYEIDAACREELKR